MTKILVVDDEPQILRALRINLAARHYEVAVAGDGASALRQAAERHPDLVVLDLGLPDQFLARIRAVSRRAVIAEAELTSIQIGEHTVDLTSKTVSGGLRLTPIEWHILENLLRNPGKLILQRYLLTEVWGSKHVKETHYLRQYMAQLRKKLEPDPAHPKHLITEPGMGCRYTR